jgi:isoamylase
LNQLLREANIAWHGVKLEQPDWSSYSHSLALSLEIRRERLLVHVILNAYWEPLDFELPVRGNGDKDPWRRWIDTSLDSPHDIVEWRISPPIPGQTYRAGPRSVVVLWAGLGGVGSPAL